MLAASHTPSLRFVFLVLFNTPRLQAGRQDGAVSAAAASAARAAAAAARSAAGGQVNAAYFAALEAREREHERRQQRSGGERLAWSLDDLCLHVLTLVLTCVTHIHYMCVCYCIAR